MHGELVRTAVLQSLRDGCSHTEACAAAGIGTSTFHRWYSVDEAFRVRVDASERIASKTVEDALFRNAKKGNVVAQIFWLCNREPERWRNVNQATAIAISNSSATVTGADAGPLTDEEKAALLTPILARAMERLTEQERAREEEAALRREYLDDEAETGTNGEL